MNRQIEKGQIQYVVQKYVKRPALYNGHKYDFRIYVLITSVISPMQIFLYNDGLVRLATEKYKPDHDLDDHYVHLTNYSLNKDNNEFDENKHKFRLKDILKGELTSTSSNGKVYRKHSKQIWAEIEQMVVKSVFTIQPQLAHLYRTSQAKEPDCCCDLLGFDVMLDHKLKPWMLEVNHMPSFKADTGIDHTVKHGMIKNTLQILQLSLEQRRQMEAILKQEKLQNMQVRGAQRMSAQEHCQRVKFDYNLVDQYIPGNNYKRIYPLDPGRGGYAANGDELEHVYRDLEKSANLVWKKQAGTLEKKRGQDPNKDPAEKKKKKGKNKKHLLTSMTSHVPVVKKEEQEDDQDEEEEEPEDGFGGLEQIREQDNESIGEVKITKDDDYTTKFKELRESKKELRVEERRAETQKQSTTTLPTFIG